MDKLQWIKNKILSREALLKYCHGQQVKGRRIVFTNGCFDILHAGHLDVLTKAADEGDILIVGVNTDASVSRLKGPERPLNKETDRAMQLAALLFVDAVCLFDEDTPLELITALKPDVLVKGGDYTPETIVGAAAVLARGGKLSIVPLLAGYSTTGLIGKIRSL